MNRKIITILAALAPIAAVADDAPGVTIPAPTAVVRGVTRNLNGEPLGEVRVAVCNMNENTPHVTLSANDGTFLVAGLTPGQYQITAQSEGYATELPLVV